MRGSCGALLVAALASAGCNATSDLGSNAADAATDGQSPGKGHSADGGATGASDSSAGGHVGPDGSAPDAGGDGSTPTGEGGSGNADAGGGTTDGSGGATDASNADGATGAGDAAGSGDGAGGATTQGPCSAGAVRCDGNLVESCNSSGTAWLYEATCPATCSGGLCTGACTPGATRCNGSSVETCNAAGTAYATTASCASTFCSSITGGCALPTTEITAGTTNWDGVVVVDGDLVVDDLATLYSPTGDLTIYASSITVQLGGTIAMAASGSGPLGAGSPGPGCDLGAGGGGYGASGSVGGYQNGTYYGGVGGLPFGSGSDAIVSKGGPGGSSYWGSGGAPDNGGAGGGVLRLYAQSVTVAGQITANGANGTSGPGATCKGSGSGAGAGGGILVAAPTVTVSGSISAAGGTGGDVGALMGEGGNGGPGRIKILTKGAASVTGTLTGTVTQGMLPPIPVTSISDPSPALAYNDGFPSFDFSWSQPFPGVQGYYVLASVGESVPGPGNGQFVPSEYASLPSSGFTFPPGVSTWYLQVVPVTAGSTVGSVASYTTVQINTSPPTVSSSTNPSSSTWLTGGAPYFSWTFPGAAGSVSASYYVLDHQADTVPDTTATMLPGSQTSLQLSGVADGIWFFHLRAQDTRGHFTRAAAHYQVNLGANPGTGTLEGQVVDASSNPVAGATVSLDGGAYTTTTSSIGNYTFSSIPAVTWQVTATLGGNSVTASETVSSGGITTAKLTL